ncbi:MAG: hypothetical protein Q4D16_01735 [Eubacteriales bacterium]|nr:hypothetical protein [Eubacteriales bacterium]
MGIKAANKNTAIRIILLCSSKTDVSGKVWGIGGYYNEDSFIEPSANVDFSLFTDYISQ